MMHLVMESAKRTHLYHYYQHPEIGLMNIRVQTWFPFSVDVCIKSESEFSPMMKRRKCSASRWSATARAK
jgi:hypothetical protein